MEFLIQKCIENLRERDKTSQNFTDQRGLAHVVEAIWNHFEPSDVDFDAFSYADVLTALEEMESIDLWTDDGEVFEVRTDSPFYILGFVQQAIHSLYHSPNKIYDGEQTNLFI